MIEDHLSSVASPTFDAGPGAAASLPCVRERLSLAIKRSLLKTPLEPLAWFLSFDVAPLVQTALKPEFASLHSDNRYILRTIRKVAAPDMRCIDVGAHIGLFLRAFEKCAPGGRHIAVEPLAAKAEKLRRKFPDAEIFACALGERAGRAVFVEDLEKSAYSGLRAHRPAGECERELREIDVEVRTLDAIALDGPRVGLVKIDAEGAECAVLRGAARLIARDRPTVIFECGAPESSADPGAAVFDMLTAQGYRIFAVRNFVLDGPCLSREAFGYCRRYPAITFNFVAAP